MIEDHRVTEMPLGTWAVKSTAAVDVTACIVSALRSVSLEPKNIVSASFDGASNMSGRHGGVQALLREHSPHLIFVHCRSHLLQLALVQSARSITEVKRALALLNKLYAMFSHSPKRLSVLQATEVAVDGISHKLVQPGETRWLSYDGSVAVVLKHYSAICLALEAIYADAGDLSCDAGGLLVELRKVSNMYILCLLHSLLQPLARLSKVLQNSEGNIAAAMEMVKAVLEDISQYKYDVLTTEFESTKLKVVDAGVILNSDSDFSCCTKLARKFVTDVLANLRRRFSDDVSQLCSMQTTLREKPEIGNFEGLARLLQLDSKDLQSEWKILRRVSSDLSSQTAMIDLATSPEKIAMFPLMSKAVRLLLLLPLGTATVERSFSTMKRIVSSSRNRLDSDHVRQLMLLSVEGVASPDVRNASIDNEAAMSRLIDSAYAAWLRKPRRLGLADP